MRRYKIDEGKFKAFLISKSKKVKNLSRLDKYIQSFLDSK